MRRFTPYAFLALAAASAPAALVACSGDDSSGAPPKLDAGLPDNYVASPDGSTPAADGAVDAPVVVNDAGFSLAPNPPVAQGSLATGQLLLTASGEILALDGYNFPAVNSGDGVFADGWEVRFDHFIATFDKVSLWNNPDLSPTDQSQHGSLIAELDGPWAVDLHQNGAAFPYIDGKEQGERAVAFAVLTSQNKNGNAPFPTDGTRLAVGFSASTATPSALNVNLGPDGLTAYQYMIANGCVALYVGQAQWNGDQAPGVCATPSTSGTDAGGVGDGGVATGKGTEPEFGLIPRLVNFDLCFKPRAKLAPGSVETNYINCDNQDNDPAPGFTGEPHQRGIAFKSNTYTVGEVTFHTDHPFWESTVHDTPARFDQFAAQVVGVTADGGVPTVHLEDTLGVDYRGFKDKQGNVLPWRTCDPNYQNPNGGGRVGQMHFDNHNVSPTCTNMDPSTGFCDYFDFSKYDQSTQGHWNGADGLCFVQRQYPSPP